MRFTSAPSVASALLLLSIGAQSSPIDGSKSLRTKRGVTANTWKPTAFSASSNLAKTTNYVELQRVKSGNPKHNAAQLQGLCTRGSAPTAGLTSLIEGQEFAVPIKVGTQSFEVILDTGSSDTWLVEQGFKCFNVQNDTAEPYAECGFGPAYSREASFKTIPNEFLNITYGDGEFLYGIFGTETVTLAGVAVQNQTMALATSGGWNGDNTTSGLTGFAYPALTSAYSASGKQQVYNPLFTSMYEDHLVAPYFSLAILRDVSGPAGYLTLGGLPPVDFEWDFATTPILITTVTGYPQTYDFYTIAIDGFESNGKSMSSLSGARYIVDSGTTLNYYPTDASQKINAAFVPPATYDASQGAYVVDCNAKAPKHSVVISGKKFEINHLDMILNVGDNQCISGITDGGSDPAQDVYILGDVFQKNVVSVFDVGAVEMTFAPHVHYKSNDHY